MIESLKTCDCIILNLLALLGIVSVIFFTLWVAGPLRWLIDSRRIKRIISRDCGFRYVFHPEINKYKKLTFLENGQIGTGQNNCEHTWLIRRGTLEINDINGKVRYRFVHDPANGSLIYADVKSPEAKFLIPAWD